MATIDIQITDAELDALQAEFEDQLRREEVWPQDFCKCWPIIRRILLIIARLGGGKLEPVIMVIVSWLDAICKDEFVSE